MSALRVCQFYACNLFPLPPRLGRPRPSVCFSVSSTTIRRNQTDNRKSVGITTVRDTKAVGPATIGEKVKQTTKDASYLGVIVAGLGVTGLMFYAIFRELFSGESPNSIYSSTLEHIRQEIKVTGVVGTPVKGFGELSSRGRRRHVSHLEFIQDGIQHMRMKFYIQGPQGRGTVHLEVKKNENGKYDYRYLFVELESGRTIVLEDKRFDHVEPFNVQSL